MQAISLIGGLIERGFAVHRGEVEEGNETEADKRSELVAASTYVVAKTLGMPSRFSVHAKEAWGEDIKQFSESMRSVASVSQSVVRGIIATMNTVQAEREAELLQQKVGEDAAREKVASEHAEERAFVEAVSAESEEEIVGMSLS